MQSVVRGEWSRLFCSHMKIFMYYFFLSYVVDPMFSLSQQYSLSLYQESLVT